MPPRANPFSSLNAGALSHITKYLGVRNHARLAAAAVNGNLMRNATRRSQASIATIQRYRDKFAQRVAGAIMRVIAAHRRNPTQLTVYNASTVSPDAPNNEDDQQMDVEVVLDAQRRGSKILTIRYFQPKPLVGAYTFGHATYYVRVQNGAYRIMAEAKFTTSGHPSKKTHVYMQNINRRAVQLYRAHPIPV